MKSNPYRRFVFLFLAVSGIPILLLAFLNWMIDPFDYFQSPRHKWNTVKIAWEKQQRLHQALEITRQKPEAIFLGSSRLMAGLDPADFSRMTGLKAYNAGFAGASMEEIYHYFEHALHHQPHLKVVVVGLDLFAFGKNKRPQKDFSEARLKNGTFEWKNSLSILMSKTALRSSFDTIRENLNGQALPYFLPNGLYNPAVIDSPNNEYLVKGDLAYVKMIFENTDFYYRFSLGENKIQLFKQMVQQCQEKGIALKVFFCPSKAIYWESLYRKELWPVLEELKRKLSAIHPIWDFSGFNCVTTQALEATASPLYYECSHFRPFVGNLILQKIIGFSADPADFGYLLTNETVDAVLEQIKQDRVRWLKTAPPVISQL
ncbi:hypothetical protein [Candidatus Protochlamydia phocaeensis]|uniref:hypothetical protein n=1 Tax=Candidatus Protochlamydia phocaeensis TaxID=1414722 RepID=UPI0008396145|nr:hypothetical protein [Candidatus Protochlamydia phocaeensis]